MCIITTWDWRIFAIFVMSITHPHWYDNVFTLLNQACDKPFHWKITMHQITQLASFEDAGAITLATPMRCLCRLYLLKGTRWLLRMECFHLVKHTTLGKENYRMPRSGKGVTLEMMFIAFICAWRRWQILDIQPNHTIWKISWCKDKWFWHPTKIV
jgi:hypothetical protein